MDNIKGKIDWKKEFFKKNYKIDFANYKKTERLNIETTINGKVYKRQSNMIYSKKFPSKRT